MKKLVLIVCTLVLLIGCKSEEKKPESVDDSKQEIQTLKEKEYSPYVGDYEPTPLPVGYDKPLWGDTHLHTSYSTDAGMIGNTLGPEEAYKFARGEEVIAAQGLPVRLIRPLDFLVVADHAENLGLAAMISESNADLLKNEWGKAIHDMVKEGKEHEAFQKWIGEGITTNIDPINEPSMTRTAWIEKLFLQTNIMNLGNLRL